jgi:hypothetical protein
MSQHTALIEHEALDRANVAGADASARMDTTEATASVISLRFIWTFSHSTTDGGQTGSRNGYQILSTRMDERRSGGIDGPDVIRGAMSCRAGGAMVTMTDRAC